ncbi:DUF6114 domain-containing protein [Streptomyces sp. NPDC019443]|uniref:DUF6114 domain-containing protein n=1 Tax=Streptomyces sp. NPDC019443 TaxID=3365061 RepID=UPI00379A580C
MSAESTGSRGFTYWRLRFRAWRGNRPFWAGLFTLLGGIPIAYLPYADLRLGNLTIAMATTAGAGSLIIGVLLMTLGLTMWFHAVVRVFAGVATIVLGLISIPVANIGGFLIGFLLSLIGGAMSISWVPAKPAAEPVKEFEPEGTPGPDNDAGDLDFPEPRADEGYDPNVTGTTAHANGGRNSAG